jgi:Protein of unknown function (DUF3592)
MVAFLVFKLLIFFGLLIFLCYFFVYNVIIKLLQRRRIRINGQAVQATVVDYKILKDSAGAPRYFPIIRYLTQDNQVITVQSRKERFKKYEVGKQLTVYYLPSDPSRFVIAGLFPYIKLTGFIFGLLGAGLLLLEIIKTLKRLLM